MATDPDVLTLALRGVFPAPQSRVFAACSDAHELAEWWGPEGFTVPSLDFRPRVGRRYRIEMQPPEGDVFYLAGQFTHVDDPSLLGYTFVWEDPDPDDVENQVVLSLRAVGDATEVALRHGPFMTEARLALHRDGWGDSFAKLRRLISDRR